MCKLRVKRKGEKTNIPNICMPDKKKIRKNPPYPSNLIKLKYHFNKASYSYTI